LTEQLPFSDGNFRQSMETLKQIMRKILRLFIALAVILITTAAIFMLWQTLNEFRPKPVEEIKIVGEAAAVADTLSFVTYNIGYCGLGAGMDFFYEGGTMVRPGKEEYDRHLGQCIQRLNSFKGNDFIFLQEVDTLAKRSWYSNQLRLITTNLTSYSAAFALNYKSWVPMPLLQPMGLVRAGLLTLSKQVPVSAERHAFSTGYSWPMRLFMLKRCFVETRYKTAHGRDLIIINTHNSAFSDAAGIREKELAQLKEAMEAEYKKGNYVIVGGDWNQNPATFDSTLLLGIYAGKTIRPSIPDSFLPDGWSYAYDPLHSTNRDVNIPYREKITRSTLIDFFIVSPNVEVIRVNTLPTAFEESDHQPVSMLVYLKQN